MKHDGQRRPEEIEADIERTRGDLHRTLSAIEQRLSPGELVDRGLQYLRDNGAREYLGNLGQAARRDPVPLALVGVGLAWLAISSRRAPPERIAAEGGSTLSGAGASLASARDSVTDALTATSDRIAHGAQSARERASVIGDGARRQAERVREGYAQLLEHPLSLGAIGLALGAVLAASAPRTRTEQRRMGESSDRLADGLKHATRPGAAAQLDGERDGAEPASAGGEVANRPAQPDVRPGAP